MRIMACLPSLNAHTACEFLHDTMGHHSSFSGTYRSDLQLRAWLACQGLQSIHVDRSSLVYSSVVTSQALALQVDI